MRIMLRISRGMEGYDAERRDSENFLGIVFGNIVALICSFFVFVFDNFFFVSFRFSFLMIFFVFFVFY